MTYENTQWYELDKRKRKQYSLMALFIYAVVITDIIRLISTISGISTISNAVEPLRNIIYVTIFAGYYYYSGKRERTTGIIIGILYFLLLLLSLLLNPGLEAYGITLSLLFVSRFLLAFVMIRNLEYPQLLIRKVFAYSLIIPVYVLLYAIAPKNLATGYAYSITFSYNLLLPTIAAFYCFYVLKERRILAILISVVALGGMIAYGSRGTIVCTAVGVLYILFYNREKYSARKFVAIIGISIFAFSFLFMKDSIFSALANLFPNSRSLYLLQSGNFLWDSNRNHYFEMASEFLQKTPFRVTGLAGDVFVYGNLFGMGVELGSHSHNLFIELVVSYGVLLGGIGCIYLVYRIIKSFYRARRSPEMRDLCAFIIVPLLPYILISGSMCQSYQYWLILGGYSVCIISHSGHIDNTSYKTYKYSPATEINFYHVQDGRCRQCLAY